MQNEIEPCSLKTPNDWINKCRRHRVKRLKSWSLTWLPGYELDGIQRYATFAVRKYRGWWQLELDYFELDWRFPLDWSFEHALESVGPDPCQDTWEKHEDSLPRHARLSWGGWRWWGGTGLSKPLVDELQEIVVTRYADAREIFATYIEDEWRCLVPPETTCPHHQKETVLQ
jgi:hypothetical protein